MKISKTAKKSKKKDVLFVRCCQGKQMFFVSRCQVSFRFHSHSHIKIIMKIYFSVVVTKENLVQPLHYVVIQHWFSWMNPHLAWILWLEECYGIPCHKLSIPENLLSLLLIGEWGCFSLFVFISKTSFILVHLTRIVSSVKLDFINVI